MSYRKLGPLALVIAAAVLWVLPTASSGQDRPSAEGALSKLGATVEQAVTETTGAVQGATRRTRAGLGRVGGSAAARTPQTRAPASDPQIQPPLRGTNPHGQGTVAVVDAMPSDERPAPDSTDDPGSSGEEAILGRSRGEQQADGSYRGHITAAELLGAELAGVNTAPGETKHGPLEPIQTNILDPLCTSSTNNGFPLCLSVLTMDSSTTASGSSNDFAVARAQTGGLRVGAAESRGNISGDANCQTSSGEARTANVTSTGGVVAGAANSSSTSRQCRGEAEQTTQSSEVLNLGGTGVPVPAPGCASGTPDTRFATLAPVATIVCNAEELGGSGVRHALDVFALSAGGTSLVQESSAQSESKAVAPAGDGGGSGGGGGGGGGAGSGSGSGSRERGGTPQCSDDRDNDGDGLIDSRDPGCHTDGNANNPDSYDPSDDSEADSGNRGAGAGGRGGDAECSDGVDNDGDGVIDSRDPGCHTDGNVNNPGSYDPSDDSEADAARNLGAGALPFTGSDVIGLAIAGLLMLAGGLVLRRREVVPRER